MGKANLKIYSLFLLLLTLIPISKCFPYFDNAYSLYIYVAIQLFFAFIIIANRRVLWGGQAENKWLKWYFLWFAVCVLRGLFLAGNYMEYKQLLMGTISCIVPIVIYLFDDPKRTSYLMQSWFKVSILLIISFCWIAGLNQFYLAPYLLLFCFFPIIKNKWVKFFVFILAIGYILNALDARSQVVKGAVALLLGFYTLIFSKYKPKLLKFGHFLGYFSVFFLFAFILTDATGVLMGNMDTADARYNNDNRMGSTGKDSRSLLIVDVVESSIKHGYMLFGHTPARGYEIGDSGVLFLTLYENENTFNKGERHKNEMVLTNIYTWLGLIGLILYSMLYFRASYLAVYRSENRFLPLLGCFIAFRWSFGWVEDVNNFYIQDVSLWMMIAMCLSSKYRSMSDTEFMSWFNSLISRKKIYLQ